MAVTHVVGRLGSGKTMYAVQRILDDLVFTQRHIYTNIRLVDFWNYRLATYVSRGVGTFIRYLLAPFPSLYTFRCYLSDSYANRYHYFSDISDAIIACTESGVAPEGSKVFLWDEVHLDMNARSWKANNMDILKFLSMSRKLGFDVVLISQLRAAVDRQMRDLADLSYELKSMRFVPVLKWLPLIKNKGIMVKRWANRGFDSADSKSMFAGAGIVNYSGYVKEFYDTKQILTDKRVESPLVYRSRDVCAMCKYTDFYRQNLTFVETALKSGELRQIANLPMPRRLL